MIVGIMQIEFKIPESFSLKDKRRVIKSLIDRTRRKFNVSIAETDDNDVKNYAVLSISNVSNSKIFTESMFDKILNFLQANFEIEIISARKEFL